MAEVIVRYRTDDMEEAAEVRADETVCFGLDGKFFEMDLGTRNATKLRSQMAPWVAHAREVKVPIKGGRLTPAKSASDKSDQRAQDAAIREWCIANGVPVATRGRLGADARTAFAIAHGEEALTG